MYFTSSATQTVTKLSIGKGSPTTLASEQVFALAMTIDASNAY